MTSELRAPTLITEEQDIVYRQAHEGPQFARRPAIELEFVPDATRPVTLGAVELFRYSALTFNAHRIHYDRDYARQVEGYRDLVVHGPLLATLAFDHLTQVAGGRRISEFSFRAVSPSYDGEALVLGALVEGDEAKISVTNPAGLALSGNARLEAP